MSTTDMPTDATPEPFRHVAVIGCGLIGGSFALASLAAPDVERVTVWDADPETLAIAATKGLDVAVDAESAVRAADLGVLAIPVGAIVGMAESTGKCMNMRSVLTDVGSTKGTIVKSVVTANAPDRGLDLSRRFVGGHPMTGSEQEGFAAADPALFEGSAYVLTPTDSTDADALHRLAAHIRAFGARVLMVSPTDHDRMVAVVSHLPQILSSVLMAHAGAVARTDAGVLRMAGGGFRDVTRVAGSNPDLWVGIIRENRDAVLQALTAYGGDLDTVTKAVSNGDWDGLRGVLVDGREARGLLPRKDTPHTLVDLVVPVPDTPGSLAAVTTTLGGAGINIEDVSMRHVEEGGRGVFVVAVGQDDLDRAVDALTGAGFACHAEVR